MKKTLFQYAVILHKRDDKGKITDSELIIEPTTILGKDQDSVAFKIVRLVPEKHAENPENVEIIIKPF